jgi:hypothetical protein
MKPMKKNLIALLLAAMCCFTACEGAESTQSEHSSYTSQEEYTSESMQEGEDSQDSQTSQDSQENQDSQDSQETTSPTALYTAENAANYGAAGSAALTKAYEKFIAGKTGADEYLTAFRKECPILPIAYLKDTLYYTGGLSPSGAMSVSAPLGNLAKWTAK